MPSKGILKLNELRLDNLVLDTPVDTKFGKIVNIWNLAADNTRQRLRFQLGSPQLPLDEWPEVLHGGTVRARQADAPHTLSLDAILHHTDTIKQLSQLESRIKKLFAEHAPHWWPGLQKLTGNNVADYVDSLCAPLVDAKKIQCRDQSICCLQLSPWRQPLPNIVVLDKNKHVLSPDGDVTNFVGNIRVLPIVHVSGLLCMPRRIKFMCQVTDILIVHTSNTKKEEK